MVISIISAQNVSVSQYKHCRFAGRVHLLHGRGSIRDPVGSDLPVHGPIMTDSCQHGGSFGVQGTFYGKGTDDRWVETRREMKRPGWMREKCMTTTRLPRMGAVVVVWKLDLKGKNSQQGPSSSWNDCNQQFWNPSSKRPRGRASHSNQNPSDSATTMSYSLDRYPLVVAGDLQGYHRTHPW